MLVYYLLLVGSLVLGQPVPPPNPDVYWFDQVFDHSDPNSPTWKQRYLVYDKYWSPLQQSTIFFCPGGESDVMDGYNHNGLMFELAQIWNAFLLFPEHRFYGQSLPFGPVDSYKPGNIEKLTIEQAMADYVAIIKYVKQQWNISDTVVIVAFGGSYPGDLTVYMRAAYPEIIDAGLASSAPLRYHLGMVDNGAFYEVVTNVFGTNNPNCPDLVREAFIQIFQLAQTQSGRDTITQKLNLCSPLEEGPDALKLLSLWVENAFATLGMADYPYSFDGMPPYPLEASCDIMSSYDDPIVGLGQAVGVFYNATTPGQPPLTCFNISNEYYPCADITGCGGGVGDPDAMSWDYQSCTELVSNVDTNNVTDMFPDYPYDFPSLQEYCMKQWNAVPQPFAIPSKYNYTTLTNLILSNGKLDPWHPGGVLPGDGCPPALFCFLIDEAAHHLDLRGTDPVHDPAAVLLAREQESMIIGDWILTLGQEKKERLSQKLAK